MIPLGDDNRDRRTTPFVTWGLIALSGIVFVLFQNCGTNERFLYAFSTVPQEIITGKDLVTPDRIMVDPSSGERYLEPGLQATPVPVILTVFMSMFMHAGLAHIIGNMLYLSIFGDNVEDWLGHFRFLLFYLFCGMAASLAHVYGTMLMGGTMTVPSLGASGAISGILGGYFLLFPRRRVRVLMFYSLIQVPALIVVGLWFVFQIVDGLGYLGGGTDRDVAYAAHIGGFVAGLVTVRIWGAGRRASAQRYR